MNIEEMVAERQRAIDEGNTIAESLGDAPTQEQRDGLRAASAKMKELDQRIAEATEDNEAAEMLRAAKQAEVETKQRMRTESKPVLYGKEEEQDDQNLTPGETYVRSAAYENLMKQFPGGRNMPRNYQGDTVSLGSVRETLGLIDATERMRGMRAIVTSNDASAGKLTRPDYKGLIEPGLVRALRIRDLVTVVQTSTDAIEYAKELSRTSNAATVAEASALTGTSGTKPQGDLSFDVVSDTVKTIAEWVPATKRILSDANGLRTYIDAFLTYDLGLALENQIYAGDASGENFDGLTHVTGVNTQGADSGPLYALRKAKTQIQINGRTSPNAVVMHPNDVEQLDLAVVTPAAGANVNDFVAPGGPYGNPQRTVWGMAIIESEAATENTALMGDYRFAVLFDREETNITVGTVNDDFIRNIVRVLAEMRAGFGVIRPKAFCKVTL